MPFIGPIFIATGLLFSAGACFAMDLPAGKLVDEASGWMFGGQALTLAGILWALTAIGALSSSVQRVTFGHLAMFTFAIILWFGAPTYVPLIKDLV